jgi:hypothetical protein
MALPAAAVGGLVMMQPQVWLAGHRCAMRIIHQARGLNQRVNSAASQHALPPTAFASRDFDRQSGFVKQGVKAGTTQFCPSCRHVLHGANRSIF